jgi:O-antigen/teichoic acid export membrane protein
LNIKVINFIKNFSYSLSSNLLSFLISTLVVLIIPKLIGVKEYGYWQLYLLYSSYVGLLHFGWNDGIYLRYGGKEYEDLDKKLFFSQFYMLLFTQIIIAAIIFLFSVLFLKDVDKIFIIQMTSICLLIVNARYMLIYILQSTYRIKEYSKTIIIDRILYFSIISLFLISGIRDYKLMVVSDLIAKLAGLLYAVYCCRDIVFKRISLFSFYLREVIENITAGIKLMFSNIAGKLIIGIIRFGMEYSWDVSTFGKVSLALSASNFMVLFINALGLIMFPVLRRTNEKRLPGIYMTMRNFLILILLGVLVIYYPFKVVLSIWLPEYAESLLYMSLVFPMCIYEGKMALLINTYLKTLRKEKIMLLINLLSLGISLLITIVTTLVIKSLDLAVASIVFLLALRSILGEIFLSKILKISIYKDIILEIIMTLVFILTGWFINSWLTFLLYLLAYIIYLIIKRKEINSTMKNIKSLLKINVVK